MKWPEIPDNIREDILLAYLQTPGYRTLLEYAEAYEISLPSLQRAVQKELKQEAEDHPVLAPLTTSSQKPPPALTDLYYLNPSTDQPRFVDQLYQLADEERFIRVMHACDFHFPYAHPGAAHLCYQLIAYYQPHLVVVGSDVADFSILSKFVHDADEEDNEDVLDEFESYYTPYIHAIHEAAPQAVLVFILGNHEKRIYDFMLRQSPELRKTVWRRFVEIVRCGGWVHWLGEVDSVRLGPLLIMHGNRATLNPAKNQLEDIRHQVSVMAGHVHRLSRWEGRGEDYPVVSVTSGCHCLYPPHYNKRKRMISRWQLGTALAEIDLLGREVVIHNLEYQLEPDLISVRFERHLFFADNPRPEGSITYQEYKQSQ